MAKKDKGLLTGGPVRYQTSGPAGGVQMKTFSPWTLVKRGVKQQVITPIDAPDQFQMEATVERQERKAARHTPLIRALGLAHYWQRLLHDGRFRKITEIAAAAGLDRGQVSRIAQLTRLSSAVIEACIAGGDIGLVLGRLICRGVPVDWDVQRPKLLTLCD